jgi:hypothetical protein
MLYTRKREINRELFSNSGQHGLQFRRFRAA